MAADHISFKLRGDEDDHRGGFTVDLAEQWGVWRSDGEWLLQRVTRKPWVAESKEDAEREASEMNWFASATMYGETYEARMLPPIASENP